MSDDPEQSEKLRRRAEDRLQNNPFSGFPTLAPDDLPRLVHELQVHQIELEMQNEELKKAQSDVEALLQSYTDLYDFAPVGYISLDADATIRQLNLASAKMLHSERAQLQGKRFGAFVDESDLPKFNDFLKRVFTSDTEQHCTLKLTAADQLTFSVQIEAQPDSSGQMCRACLTDISALKRLEAEISDQCDNLEVRVTERTVELRKIVKLMTGREVRMAGLKTAIKKLRKQLIDAGLKPVADDPIYEDR